MVEITKSSKCFFHCRKETCLAHWSALVNTQTQAVCLIIDIFTTKIFKIAVKILQIMLTFQRSLPILIISWHLMRRLLRLKNKMAELWPYFNRLQAVACILAWLSSSSDSSLSLWQKDLHSFQCGFQVWTVFQCANPLFVFNANIEQDLKQSLNAYFAHLITN